MVNETMKAHLRELFAEALEAEDLQVDIKDWENTRFSNESNRYEPGGGRSLVIELRWERKS